MKPAAELLEMSEGELLAHLDRVRTPEARAALLAELLEMKRVDQKFLEAGFPPEWVKLLHSEICIALGLENDIESDDPSRADRRPLRAIVRHVMGIKHEDEL